MIRSPGLYEVVSPRRAGKRVEASSGNEITLNKRGGAERRGGGTLTCARGRLPVISLETGESSWLPYLVREPFSRCFVSSSLWHRLWRPSLSPSAIRPLRPRIPSSSRPREPRPLSVFLAGELQVSAGISLYLSFCLSFISFSLPRPRFCARSR